MHPHIIKNRLHRTFYIDLFLLCALRYRQLQKEIKKKYSRADNKNGQPTFEEYWRYLIDLTADLDDPRDWNTVDCVRFVVLYYNRMIFGIGVYLFSHK